MHAQFGIDRIRMEYNLLKNAINSKPIFTGFARFWRECGCAQMNEVMSHSQLDYALPVPFRIHRIWK